MLGLSQKDNSPQPADSFRAITLVLGLLACAIIIAIIFLSFQLRDTLLSEEDKIQNNDVYIQRQMGAEIFRLNSAFERFLNGSGTYTEFIIKYDILFSRIDQLDRTPFFQEVATRIGYEDTVYKIQTTVRDLDKTLSFIEEKKPEYITQFRQNMGDVVLQWEGFSHALLSYRIEEKNIWRNRVLNDTYKIAIALTILFVLFCFIIVIFLKQIQLTRAAFRREQELTGQLAETAKELEVAANAKDMFLSTMSHEVRTPLNAISGFAQILTNSPLNPKQMQQVNIIDNAARRLEYMFKDILDYIDLGKSSFKPHYNTIELKMFEMDVRLSIQRLIDESGKNLGLRCEIDKSVVKSSLHSDAELIKRVLLHFATNAIKHSVSGRLYFYIRANGDAHDSLRLGLKDQGVGIDPSFQQKVFEAFSQAEHKNTSTSNGSGMGLAISHQLVLLLGGDIDFESQPGVGSDFWINLPLNPKPKKRP